MIRITLNKPKTFQSVSFTRADLAKIGNKVIDTMEKRCARGLNVNDRAAKPLSADYVKKKRKAGEPAVRNLVGSGSMFRDLGVLHADQDQVTIGFTSQKEQIKAAANNRRDPWFGLSPKDEHAVIGYAAQLLQARTKQ